MKAVIQRVSQSSVTINEQVAAQIQNGLLVLIGIEDADNQEDINWLTSKIANLRIFGDENEVMNLSLKDIDGEMIVVSQFTLHALTKKGNRPSYIKASKPEIAIPLYESFVNQMEIELGKKIQPDKVWHTPYVDHICNENGVFESYCIWEQHRDEDACVLLTEEEALAISTSCCGVRVYRTGERGRD